MNERCQMFGDCPNPPAGWRVCTVGGEERSRFLICEGHAAGYPIEDRARVGGIPAAGVVTRWFVVPL